MIFPVNALLVVPFAFGVWWFVMQLKMRRYLKQRFPPVANEYWTDFCSCGEGCWTDCLTIFFCYPCALAQEGRVVFDYDKHPEFRTCSPFTDPGWFF